MYLDSRPSQGKLNSGPLEHSVPDRAPRGGAVLCERLTMSDPLEHSVSVGPPQGRDGLASEVPLLEEQPETAGLYQRLERLL